MKRLIIINVILLLLLSVLPSERLELKENQVVAQVSEQVITQDITSRSAEPRKEEISTSDNLSQTTYSENCINLIKKYESFKGQAYKLKGEKYWTIGYGHHGSDVKPGQVVSEEEADRILRADLKGTSDFVLKYCNYFEITQNQLDALTSFTYNGGPGMLQQLTANKTRSPEEIVEHIEFYTKSSSETFRKGLKNRRLEEKELFLGGSLDEQENC